MLTRRSLILAGAALAGAAALGPLAASAQSADALRESGDAGERYDGFMEARKASAASAVDAINAERRKVYSQRAVQQGVTADQVGRVFAQQIIKQSPAGTWIKTEGGQWVQK